MLTSAEDDDDDTGRKVVSVIARMGNRDDEDDVGLFTCPPSMLFFETEFTIIRPFKRDRADCLPEMDVRECVLDVPPSN